MATGVWLLLAVIFWIMLIPFWVYRVFRSPGAYSPVCEQIERQGVLPEEWAFVGRQHCLPSACPRLCGESRVQPRDDSCEICAALYMERTWQRMARRPQFRWRLRERRPLKVCLLLAGSAFLLLRLDGSGSGGYVLLGAVLALLAAGIVAVCLPRKGGRRRLTPHGN